MDTNALDRDIKAGLSYDELKKRHHVNSDVIAHQKRLLGMRMRTRMTSKGGSGTLLEQSLRKVVQQMKDGDISRIVVSDTGKVEIHKAKCIQLS